MATTPFSPMELWHGRVGSEVYAVHNGKQVIRNYTPGKGNIEAIRRWQREHLLALVNLDDKPIVISITKMTEQAPTLKLQYSRNGVKWHLWGFTSTTPLNINVERNSRVFIRGVKNIETCLHTDDNEVITDHNQFSASGLYGLEGSILNLLDPQWKASKPLQSHALAGLFYGDTNIVTPPTLPSMYLSRDCYRSMFGGCTALKSAPVLPAKALAPYCYSAMFMNSAIETCPQLNSNELAIGCYDRMFEGCNSIVQTCDLPATIAYQNCYYRMFRACTKLVTANLINLERLATSACAYMFYGCENLVTPPVLKSKTPYGFAYQGMFESCTKLNKAVNLLERLDNANTGVVSTWLSQTANQGILYASEKAINDNIWDASYVLPSGWSVEQYTETNA